MASFIMSSRWHAILFTLAITLMSLALPPIGVFANAAVALVTLRLGAKQGLLIAIPVSIGVAIIIMVLKGDALVGLLSGLISWLPIILLGAILERTVSWTQVLQYLFLMLVGLIILFHLVVGNPAALWEQWINSALDYLPFADQKTLLEPTIKESAIYMTGAIAALMGVHWIVSLMLGRHWQAQLYNPGGFHQELRSIRMGKPFALLMLILIGARLLTDNALLTDIILVGLALFMFAGLSLIHYVAKARNLGIGWLIGLYLMLILFTPPVVLLLATLGIMDSQADFRSFINERKPNI